MARGCRIKKDYNEHLQNNEKYFVLLSEKNSDMRKIKFLVASLLFCAMSYAGYMGYERVTMSEAERFMLANVEALTSGEGGSSTSWDCWSRQEDGNGGYWRCGSPCVWINGAVGKGRTRPCYSN